MRSSQDLHRGGSALDAHVELGGAVFDLKVVGGRLYCAGADNCVSMYDTSSWKKLGRLEGHAGWVNALAVCAFFFWSCLTVCICLFSVLEGHLGWVHMPFARLCLALCVCVCMCHFGFYVCWVNAIALCFCVSVFGWLWLGGWAVVSVPAHLYEDTYSSGG